MSLAEDLLNIILTQINADTTLNKFEVKGYWDARQMNLESLKALAKGNKYGGIFVMYSTADYQQKGGVLSNARIFDRYQNILIEMYVNDELLTPQIEGKTTATYIDLIRNVMYNPPVSANPISETPWKLADTEGMFYTCLTFRGRTIYPGTTTNKFM